MKMKALLAVKYLDEYAKVYGADDMVVHFTDGTLCSWKSQRDYIIGRIHGMRDIVTSSEYNGDVYCNVYVYGGKTVNTFITFE